MSFETALDSAIRVLRQRRTRKARVSPQLRAGTQEEMEHAATIKKIKANPKIPIKKAAELIARDQLRKDPHVYDDAIEKKRQRKLKAPRLRLLTRRGKLRVYLVDATAVRKLTHLNPDAPDFTMGTGDQVWKNVTGPWEIWISNELGTLETKLTMLHEMTERRLMKTRGMSYDAAHDDALKREDYYRKRNGRGLDAALRKERGQ